MVECSFSTLNMSSHRLLASMLCDENLALNLTMDPLHTVHCFSLGALHLFTLSLAFENSNICLGVLSAFILFVIQFVSSICKSLSFFKFEKFLAIIFFKYSSCLFFILLLKFLAYICWNALTEYSETSQAFKKNYLNSI